MLDWDDAAYAHSDEGQTRADVVYTRETVNEFPELLCGERAARNGQKVTDANPQQKDFLWTKGSR